ncbi:MAG: hypothetical protein WCX65_19155 [bacterium]
MADNKEIVLELFIKKKMPLIASLPQNSVELAKAAAAGGADMLKIHMNVHHAASGTHFGSFAEERKNIEAIIAAVEIPVGIMPGAAETATFDEMRELERMGIAFFDIYTTDMPAEYLKLEEMAPMAALAAGWKEWEPEAVEELGIELLEASIVPHEQYGRRLALSDLMAYSYVAELYDCAVIVPTQKAIRPEEVAALHESGVRGLMIGKIVAGDTPSTFEAATALFAAAIKAL